MKVFYTLAVICCIGIVFAGCSYEEDLAGTKEALYPPTGLMAASVDSNSVLLAWTPSPNDSDSRFEKYKLYWSYIDVDDSSRAHPDSVELPRGTSSYIATGLTNGVEYYFQLSVIPSDIALKFFPSIRWAPAARYGGISLPTQAVLALFDTTQAPPGPVVLGLDNPGVQTSGDIYLDNDGTLKSADMKGSGWRRTLFSTAYRSASTVQTTMPAFPPISTFTDTVIAIQPQTLYYCKTQDGNYSRIFVQDGPSANGSGLLVHLEISYQTTPMLPYAKR